MKIELDHQELETVVKTVLEHFREDRHAFEKELVRTLGPALFEKLTSFMARPKIVPTPAATGTDD
jgi:hypothetical protein